MRFALVALVLTACTSASGAGSASSAPAGYCFLNAWNEHREECEVTREECAQRSLLVWRGPGMGCYPVDVAWRLDVTNAGGTFVTYVARTERDCGELRTKVGAEGYTAGDCKRL